MSTYDKNPTVKPGEVVIVRTAYVNLVPAHVPGEDSDDEALRLQRFYRERGISARVTDDSIVVESAEDRDRRALLADLRTLADDAEKNGEKNGEKSFLASFGRSVERTRR